MSEYKYYIVHMTTGYCGMDGHDILEMPADATEEELADEAYQMALANAEMYGIYPADTSMVKKKVMTNTEIPTATISKAIF